MIPRCRYCICETALCRTAIMPRGHCLLCERHQLLSPPIPRHRSRLCQWWLCCSRECRRFIDTIFSYTDTLFKDIYRYFIQSYLSIRYSYICRCDIQYFLDTVFIFTYIYRYCIHSEAVRGIQNQFSAMLRAGFSLWSCYDASIFKIT